MDKEQHNFLFGAAARDPGKRQIKPNTAFFAEQHLIAFGADDDEEDEDVIFPSPNMSRSSTDDEQQQCTTDDQHGGGEEEDEDTGGNSSDDEASGGTDGEHRPSTSNDTIGKLNNNGQQQHQHLLGKRKKKGRRNGGDGTKLNGLLTPMGMTTTDGGALLNSNGLNIGGCGDLCAICLNLRSADHCGELIQCDRCSIFVHELCYGAAAAVVVEEDVAGDVATAAAQCQQPHSILRHDESTNNRKPRKNAASSSSPMAVASTSAPDAQSVVSSASTEPWFCEPCLFNMREVPHCELCPSRYGAFKRAAGGAGWVHVLCAAFTPGIRFVDPESLGAVSWRDIDTRAFGRKACAGCFSGGGSGGVGAASGAAAVAPRQLLLSARTGVTVKCDAGMCRHFYHVTCAQRLGLLIDLESEAAAAAAHRHQQHRAIIAVGNNNLQTTNNNDNSNIINTTTTTNDGLTPTTIMVASAAASVAHRPTEIAPLHPEAGYLYCDKHVPRDTSVSRMRIAYANFVESEERRMARWNRVVLDARQERKRAAQLRDYQQRMRRVGGGDTFAATVPTAGPTQRRAKLLHTNARLLDAFAEKHELLGLDEAQFAEEFSAVPAAHLPSNLTPAFSKTFISYMEHRDRVGLPADNARLEQLSHLLAHRRQQQTEAEHGLDELRKISIDTQRARSDQQRLLDRFRSSLAKLVPSCSSLVQLDGLLPPPSSSSPSCSSLPLVPPEASKSAILNKNDSKVPPPTKRIRRNSLPTWRTKTGTKEEGATTAASATEQKAAVSMGVEQQKVPSSLAQPLQCYACKKTTEAHLLAYCDTCKCHYHIGCLDPPLAKLPAKSKFSRFECSDCAYPSD